MSVHRYLITAPTDLKMALWAGTGMFANWLEGRTNGDRETWLVTVFDEQSEGFLTAAENVGVTVEEIEGGGDTETYRLVIGEPGTGWQGSEGQAAATAAVETARRWSSHGHWIGEYQWTSEDEEHRPNPIAKCGGPRMCSQCKTEQRAFWREMAADARRPATGGEQ